MSNYETGRVEHPRWCDRQHLETWPAHTADIGEVVLDGGQVLDVSLFESTVQPAQMWLSTHGENSTEVLALTADQAHSLYDLLGAGLTALGVAL